MALNRCHQQHNGLLPYQGRKYTTEMPNITSILNDQFRRLARREIRSSTGVVRRATAQYRRDIAALKRQVAALTKTVTFLDVQEKRRVAEQPVPPKEAEDIRFRADGMKTHRAKLGLSAQDYGKLVGVTGQTIYDWESGQARPRNIEQVAKVATVRGIGKREALKRLEMLGATKPDAIRRRGQSGGETAQDFILSLVKTRKAISTSEIGTAWKKVGRGGRSDNTLSILVKAGKLKRVKIKGGRGSEYRLTR